MTTQFSDVRPSLRINSSMNDTYRILVVADEKDLAWGVASSLRNEGYEVLTAYDGSYALAAAARHRFDLIILDIVMPRMDGFRVCRELRRHVSGATRILFMAERTDVVDDLVMGLEQGGNDYLVKPFDMKELKARIHVLLCRSQYKAEETKDTEHREHRNVALEVGALTLSLETREVSAGNTVTKLTPKEFDILHHLILHFGEVLSSKDLLQQVWGYPAESNCTSLVRWHIKSLREKIEPDPSRPIYIRTVLRHGYILDAK